MPYRQCALLQQMNMWESLSNEGGLFLRQKLKTVLRFGSSLLIVHLQLLSWGGYPLSPLGNERGLLIQMRRKVGHHLVSQHFKQLPLCQMYSMLAMLAKISGLG
eukprot:6320663-Amphidinium_carterae.1